MNALSSVAAMPLIEAVRESIRAAKYAPDPAAEFLSKLHAAGYEVVKSAAPMSVPPMSVPTPFFTTLYTPPLNGTQHLFGGTSVDIQWPAEIAPQGNAP